MGQMGPRIGPRGQAPMGPMNPNYAGMRPPPPNPNMGPVGPSLPPMPMGGAGRPWQPNPSNMNFSSPSPGSHYGGPGPGNGPPGPGTPIMPSPQGSTGPYSPANHRMGTPNPGRDSANPPPDGMYPMMKQGGSMAGVCFVVASLGLITDFCSLSCSSEGCPVLQTVIWVLFRLK